MQFTASSACKINKLVVISQHLAGSEKNRAYTARSIGQKIGCT